MNTDKTKRKLLVFCPSDAFTIVDESRVSLQVDFGMPLPKKKRKKMNPVTKPGGNTEYGYVAARISTEACTVYQETQIRERIDKINVDLSLEYDKIGWYRRILSEGLLPETIASAKDLALHAGGGDGGFVPPPEEDPVGTRPGGHEKDECSLSACKQWKKNGGKGVKGGHGRGGRKRKAKGDDDGDGDSPRRPGQGGKRKMPADKISDGESTDDALINKTKRKRKMDHDSKKDLSEPGGSETDKSREDEDESPAKQVFCYLICLEENA